MFLLSANVFNVDQSEILSFGKELRYFLLLSGTGPLIFFLVMTGHKFIKSFAKHGLVFTVYSTSLLKTMQEKEKMPITNKFSFSHSVFNPFGEFLPFSSKSELLSANCFSLEKSKICRLGKG